MTSIMIGCDPEMFVSECGKVSHAIGKIGGDKECPFSVPRGGLQEDNVLAEFCMEPSDTPEGFLENIGTVMGYMRDRLAFSGLKVVPNVSSFVYKSMEGFPEKAFEFGCTPDYDAFTNLQNPTPVAPKGLRTAGGHVHIGYPSPTPEVSRRVALMCDYALGLPSVLEDNTKGASRRKQLYGKASCVRYKSYGVEYRTLSSYWLWDSSLATKVFERAKWAAQNHNLLEFMQEIYPQEDVRDVINRGDKGQAQVMLAMIGLILEENGYVHF
jgi:hypothetical protein